MRASPADIAVRFYNGDGLTVIEQSLQRACQLLALVVRQLGQAVDQARHLLLPHHLSILLGVHNPSGAVRHASHVRYIGAIWTGDGTSWWTSLHIPLFGSLRDARELLICLPLDFLWTGLRISEFELCCDLVDGGRQSTR